MPVDRRDPRHRPRRWPRGRAVRPLPGRRRVARSSGCPRSTSGCSPGPAAPSVCPASSASDKALRDDDRRPADQQRPKRSATGWSTSVVDGSARRPRARRRSPSPARAVAEGLPLVRVRDRDDKVAPPGSTPELFADFRAGDRPQAARVPRPASTTSSCIEAAATCRFEEGMKVEQQLFTRADDRAAVGRPAVLLLRRAGGEQDPRHRQGHPIIDDPDRSGVLGAGTMGGGIAMNFANVGIPVTIVERDQEALDRGLAVVRKNYERSASRGSIPAGAGRDSGWR